MTNPVIRKTPKELHEQRARLIASTGLSEAVLRERGEAFQLYPEHQAVWDTVHGIDYLLDSTESGEEVPAELERLRAEVSELYTEIEAAQKGLSDMARKRNAEMDRADKAEAEIENNRITLAEDEQHIRRVNARADKAEAALRKMERNARAWEKKYFEMVDQRAYANAALARVRALHERRDGAGGEGYCDLCANHGDVSWPCKTIAALDREEDR
ncbi:hypothetical protein ACF06T_30685 [Streptomyces albidoflavus]